MNYFKKSSRNIVKVFIGIIFLIMVGLNVFVLGQGLHSTKALSVASGTNATYTHTFILSIKEYRFEEASNGAVTTEISPSYIEDAQDCSYFGHISLKGKHKVKSIKITVEE